MVTHALAECHHFSYIDCLAINQRGCWTSSGALFASACAEASICFCLRCEELSLVTCPTWVVYCLRCNGWVALII